MKISKKKEKYINSRAKSIGGYAVASAINKNKRAEVYYRKALEKENDRFLDKIISGLKKIYAASVRAEALEKLFREYEEQKLEIFKANTGKIINKFLKLLKKDNKASVKKVLKEFLGEEISINYDKDLYDEKFKVMSSWNKLSVDRLGLENVKRIEDIVYKGVTSGKSLKSLEKELSVVEGLSKSRIKLIARDQTSKADQILNRIAQEEAGIEYFEWVGINDARERAEHKELNGKIYKWADEYERLPIIMKGKGGLERGYPGEAIQCRCDARSVFIADGYRAVWSNDSKSYVIKKIKD